MVGSKQHGTMGDPMGMYSKSRSVNGCYIGICFIYLYNVLLFVTMCSMLKLKFFFYFSCLPTIASQMS